MTLPLVLASGSRYRSELLQRLHLPFLADAPAIDEARLPGESAVTLCQRLAVAKALALAERYPSHRIIGSDQVACFGDDIIGKPGTEEKAVAQLLRFSGRAVDFLTGLALLNTHTGALQCDLVTFRVHFRKLTEDAVRRYVRLEQPLDCAGSFKAEGYGITLFERLEGDDPTSLIGLPLIRLADMLRQEGIPLP